MTDAEPSRPMHEDELHAYVDGRLDPGRQDAVRAWLQDHPADAGRVQAYVDQRDALRASLQRRYDEPVPARLHLDALRQRRRETRFQRMGAAAAGLALLLAGGAGGWLARGTAPAPSDPMALSRAAAEAHVLFASEVRHPVEVPAAQEVHLVQWLSNRLRRPLKVPDLAPLGFRLMGGRLLPGAAGPAAQLMYDNNGTRLTLFISADPQDQETSFRLVERDGLAGFYWVDQGFGYAVMAQAGRGRLLPVAQSVWHQIAGPAP